MESIGGYRLVRRLGSGSRADVYLGHAGRSPSGTPQLAALKVFQPHVPEDSIDAEISALSRLRHAHIVRLIDLATGPRNIPCLVLQRLEPGGLPRLLADRRDLEAGEAVTILAPVAAAVSAMHRAGIAHGRVGTQAVLFDEAGAPVLSGFGGAGLISTGPISGLGDRTVTGAQLDGDVRVAGDRDALAALAVTVLGRVRDASPQLAKLVDQLGLRTDGADDVADLEHRLFALAAPLPVRFASPAAENPVPHRLDLGEHRVSGQAPQVLSAAAPESLPADSGWSSQLALPPEIENWLGKLWAQAPDWLVSRLAVLQTAVRSVRRRVWVVAGVGLLAVATAVAIAQLPSGEQPSTASAAGGPTASATTAPVQLTAPLAAASDDPIVAAEALLELRAQCLRDRSILCLDAVHAPGSAAWQADAALIQAVQDGGEIGVDRFEAAGSLVLIDRMGDTALLAIRVEAPENATASVLMIRTEAGWRFRSLPGGVAPLG